METPSCALPQANRLVALCKPSRRSGLSYQGIARCPAENLKKPRKNRRWFQNGTAALLVRLPEIESVSKFCPVSCFLVYNELQLSLTHEQLKVGIANQRHPLTSSESSQHNPKKQNRTINNGRTRNSEVV